MWMKTASKLCMLAIIMLSPLAFSQSNASESKPPQIKKQKLEVSELEIAYQKEFIFLKAQKKILKERLLRQATLQEGSIAEIENRINSLQQDSINTRLQLESLTKQVSTISEELSIFDEQKQALDTTLLQSNETLSGLNWLTSKQNEEKSQGTDSQQEPVHLLNHLSGNYLDAVNQLHSLSSVKKDKGVFFLSTGEKTEGEILRIGQIAAFGNSIENAGALVPAGEGHFKIWDENNENGKILHPKDQDGEGLALFILSSQRNVIEEKEPKSLTDTLVAGGTIGWVILALGLAAMLAILIRFYHMRKTQDEHKNLEKKIQSLLDSGDKTALEQAAAKLHGASAHLLKIVLQYCDKDPEQLENAVSQGFIEESQKLERLATFITVVAAVAPLLGLLGTVTGMIATFDIITEVGAGDPKMLSGGISEALVTTMFGLIVAIPSLLLGNMLSSWGENIKSDMEKLVLKVSNVFVKA